jgi:hypothetical protein
MVEGYAERQMSSLLRLMDAYGFEIAAVSTRLTAQLAREPGYQALLTLPGVGDHRFGEQDVPHEHVHPSVGPGGILVAQSLFDW